MTTAPVQLRRAGLADVDAIAALLSELGYTSSREDLLRRLPPLLSDQTQCVFVAEDSPGTVVGCMHIGLESKLVTDHAALIMAMVVASTHRRRGIGRALVLAGEEWARAQGVASVRVRTNAIRPEAPAFYAGLGYTKTKTQFAFRKNLGAVAAP